MTKQRILLARAHDARWATLSDHVDFAPVLHVENLMPEVPQVTYQGIILTSANAARPDLLQPYADLPVYAVGDITAHMAHRAGCRNIVSAKGTVQDLVAMLTEKLDPRDGALLYLRARDISLDLANVLKLETFAVKDPIVYETKVATQLPDTVVEALEQQAYGVVGTFSQRGAGVLNTLLASHETQGSTLTGLSQSCIEPLTPRPWQQVSVSPTPTFQGLYDHIKSLIL